MTTTGKIVAVNGNMTSVAFDGAVAQNEVGYIILGEKRLMAEIVRVRGTVCDMQVFDATTDLTVGDKVEFSGELLAAELGPGMLAQVYDGLQNPLSELAKEAAKISADAEYFLQRGIYLPGLPRDRKWDWHPTAKIGERVSAGDVLGWVTEGIFDNKTMPGHKIMVPFAFRGSFTVKELAGEGDYTVVEDIATLTDSNGKDVKVQMLQRWPVKVPIKCFVERLAPTETLETTVRTIDTFFPVAVGGTYCIPGPFGAGKTVLQQTTARYAKVDIVISAACGERAGEVVETLKEFPEIVDPKTGQSLMKRTIIICNTSSMPVASREASVYTAVTLAEYFRQQGLNVLVLADSTSRWAQAMRELSGRLEEIPGEEAFPAYLESRIAAFYERAGRVKLKNGDIGSVTIGGTVS
ncbi:MAG: V-type ATP synthase subunit A, partial [Kiritimatiellae bacterium]|nr:V-type ATP synthase subunit A [Kiritimatiellia bacterium]